MWSSGTWRCGRRRGDDRDRLAQLPLARQPVAEHDQVDESTANRLAGNRKTVRC